MPSISDDGQAIGSCTRQHILSLTTAPSFEWTVRELNSLQVDLYILDVLCSAVGDMDVRPVVQMDNETDVKRLRSDCVNMNPYTGVRQNATCIRRNGVDKSIYPFSPNITNLAILSVAKDEYELEKSKACVDATVTIEYIFLPGKWMMQIFDDEVLDSEKLVLIPTSYRVVHDDKNHCEVSQSSTALFSLLYSARSNWTYESGAPVVEPSSDIGRRLSMMSIRENFQSNVVEIGRHYLGDIPDGDCTLNIVRAGAKIDINFELCVLLGTLVLCAITIFAALWFQIYITEKSWRV